MNPYRNMYANLLRLYPKSHRERFGEGMEQTFNDLCREQRAAGRGLPGLILWVFVETFAGILKENTMVITENKRIAAVVITTALILMVPFVAMQVHGGTNWTLSDFLYAGALLLTTGLMFEASTRKRGNVSYRVGAALALGTALFLVWANLAVGLIGSEDNPANLMYGGVLAVGFVGALIARFRPLGMSMALLATAAAQVLVAVIAMVAGWGQAWGVTALFVVLWVAAALMFTAASANGHERH